MSIFNPVNAVVTSEGGYYLLSELIGMSDRALAQKIELDLWYDRSDIRPDRLARYLELLEQSESDLDFASLAAEEVSKNGIEYRVANVDNGVRVSRKGPLHDDINTGK